MDRQNGFTLIELMVAIAVFAIAASIALPSFQRVIEENRVSTQTNTLISAFNLARSEAVKRGTTVGITANGASFADGWCVHLEPGGCVAANMIRSYAAPDAISFNQTHTQVVFDGRGTRSLPVAGAGTVEIDLQPDACTAGDTNRRRQVEVGLTGRTGLRLENCQ
ncbi:GspH/FimT family pseudopilin [Hydrocarboniclastica marina]|uniref:Type II secretion system protein H n=1 Tax=Hydrocarboniclastica marina TaxID=2259620 RepID=A0A4P7XEQ3_9ALTE|nr:GspH/FimT family pseudopilin [Hydrocarboniclastica marina]QCF25105.1 prepilin-type N-terminal cleavage/methylation domain-containing protein [Hydrocarboniclastica marina]